MAQQTAVDWLIKEIIDDQTKKSKSKKEWWVVFDQAKQMEKEHIVNAWRNGDNDSMYSPKELDQQAEQYYNETYGKAE